MINKISIFKTAFIQVFLVAVNTIFLSKSFIIGIAITSFLISWVWVANVKKANIASKQDRFIYAFGAMCGSLSGYLFTKLII
jgi:hypothetical protein